MSVQIRSKVVVKSGKSGGKPVYCRPKRQNFFFRLLFWTKISILTEVLVVLVLKIGGRALKGMRFQIENHRCGLYLRPGTFKEEIGQRSL